MAPNVAVYTTLLKGHMLAGDVDAAEALMRRCRARNPRTPGRARGEHVSDVSARGDTPRVGSVVKRGRRRMERGAADDATYKLIARLLAQALRVGDLRGVIDAAKRDAAAAKAAGPGGGDRPRPRVNFGTEGAATGVPTASFITTRK